MNDPGELTNVFDHADYAGVRKELEALIAKRADDRLPLQSQVGAA